MRKDRNLEILFLILIIVIIIFEGVYFLKPAWEIKGDGFGNYMYLRSLFFDHDLHFRNEQNFYQQTHQVKEHTFYVETTKTGYYPNPFAIGSAVLWTPFFLLAYLSQKIFSFTENFSLAGLNTPFQIALNFGSIFYGLLGVYFSYRVLTLFFQPKIINLAILSLFLGTPLLHYAVYEGVMSHLNSFFAAALFYYLFFKNWTRERSILLADGVRTRRRGASVHSWPHIFLGMAFGLVSLVRWQDMLFGGVFLVTIFLEIREIIRRGRFYRLRRGALPQRAPTTDAIKFMFAKYLKIIIGFFSVFGWQMLVWKIIYGSFITAPPSNTSIDLSRPQIWQFLFSPSRGMFVWTPLFAAGVIGLLLILLKRRGATRRVPPKSIFLFLFIPLALQVYLNGTLSDWFGGAGEMSSFGARRILGCGVIFAVGLATFYALFWPKKTARQGFGAALPKIALSVFVISLIAGNVLLIILRARGFFPLDLEANLWRDFWHNLPRIQ